MLYEVITMVGIGVKQVAKPLHIIHGRYIRHLLNAETRTKDFSHYLGGLFRACLSGMKNLGDFNAITGGHFGYF